MNVPGFPIALVLLVLAVMITVGYFSYLQQKRRFYNGNVREMNQLCQSFPTNLVAGAFAFHTEDYFELGSHAERDVPRVRVH